MTQDEIHERVVGSLEQGHSLYGLHKQVLIDLQPDIIFTQSLCDVCAVSHSVVVDTCSKVFGGQGVDTSQQQGEPKIVCMEPNHLAHVMATFQVAGRALGVEERAQQVLADLLRQFEVIRTTVRDHVDSSNKKPVVAFLEWHEPFFTGGHWIADMMEIAGCDYRMCKSGDRSAAMSDDDFRALDPDFILIGPCGFSLERALQDTIRSFHKRPWWKTLRAVENDCVYALDGNSYFARPGPRLLQGCGLIARCVHGEQVGEALGETLAPSSGMQRITKDMYV